MSLLRELIGALVLASAALASIYWVSSRDLTTSDPFEVRQTCVVDLDWSADGQTLLSRSRVTTENCGSHVWLHTVGDNPADRLVPTGGDFLWNAALLPNASAVLLLGDSEVLRRRDLRSHNETDLFEIPAPFTSPLAVSADGAVFAVAETFDVLLCESHSGRKLSRLIGHSYFVNDVIFSNDGRLVVTAGGDGTIRIWDRKSGECERVLSGPRAAVMNVEFVAGNRRLAAVTATLNAPLDLWDTATGELLWRKTVDECGLLALAVSPDGVLAATGGHNLTVNLWDLNRQVHSGALAGHSGNIRALRFSPDGTTLASASEDGTIRLWNVGTRALVRTIDVGKME